MDGIVRRRGMVERSGSTPVVGWLYHFNNSIVSSGTRDFGFSGDDVYTTGKYGQALFRRGATDGGDTPTYGVKATGLSSSALPDWSGTNEGTISFWLRSITNHFGFPISFQKYVSTTGTYSLSGATISNVKSGWSVTKSSISKHYVGSRMGWESNKFMIRIVNGNNTYAANYQVTPPSSFDTTQWHHYALVRKVDNNRFFIDGETIFVFSGNLGFGVSNQLCVGGLFTESNNSTSVSSANYSTIVDDLFIAEYAKWTSDFDPDNIVY